MAKHFVINEHGEAPDCGPPWACALYGSAGHDYQNCPECRGEFQRRMAPASNRVKTVVVFITDDTVVVQANTTRSAVAEHYRLNQEGKLECSEGNFEDEAIFGGNDNLVSALTSLAEAARGVSPHLK